ncbi:collagen alpha-2(XI) chain-like [Rousettus aegyptiacus]|uniref:collagen alpha-2(XI) chain-like n=1 Tax=Rousettus aegyptiacus TaxID=9407 RepID=UPI00168D4BEA|nr:collagen alpha-2(XI) chain-like [Rousettus aegyptiacus]
MASEADREVSAAMQAAEEGVRAVAGAGDGLGGTEDEGGPGGPDRHNGPGSPHGQNCPGGPSRHCGSRSPYGFDGTSAREDQGDSGAHEDQGGPNAHYDQVGAGARDHHPGGHGVPDDQGDPGAQEDQNGADAQDHPGGPGAPYEQAGHQGGPGVEERVRSAAIGAPNIQRAVCGSGPGGDAAPEDERPGERPIIFTITVPFGSHLEAEMARLAMDIQDRRHHPAIQKEFRVHGSILAVRWTAEDPGPLQDSVNSFFQMLFLVIRNIQHNRPRFPLRTGRGAGN